MLIKTSSFLAVSFLFVVLSFAPRTSQADELSFPAQALSESLRALGNQTKTNMLFDPAMTGKVAAPVVERAKDVQDALTQLLEGSGLTFKFIDARTVTVIPKDEAVREAKAPTAGVEKGERELRLAQVGGAGLGANVPDDNGATSEGGSTVQLEEIVVTAQKREERLINVPISIVALTADELHKRKVTSLDELSLSVPGLSIQSNGAYRQIMLRGVSNVFGNSSLIGLYLDEASVGSQPVLQPDLRTYDLERIEVLRGPQGTLYGEGSAGGTIRFITKNPVLDRFAMNAGVAALFTEDGAPGQRIEAMLNMPVVRNKFGLRFAGTFDHQGGWMDQPFNNREDFNDQNLLNVRVKGLWQPSSEFRADVMAIGHRNDAAPGRGEDADGHYSQVFNLATTPTMEDDYELYNATLSYDFPAARLLSASSYIEQDRTNRNLGNRLLLFPPIPLEIYYSNLALDVESFTQELRLNSIGSDPWQWTIGAFYRDFRYNSVSSDVLFGLTSPPGTPLPTPISFSLRNLSKSWASFVDASYELTARVNIGAGLRYFEDEQERVNGFGLTSDAIAPGPRQMEKFDTLNPRVYAQFKVSDRVNSYASAAKGFRSGGFNFVGAPTFDPESVWTYELGTKMSLADGRFSADAAVFYSDYRDYQINGTVVVDGLSFNVFSNAGNARIEGVEWALSWRPAERWNLSFNGDYVESEFYEINSADGSYIEGDQLDFFPKYAVAVSVQRDFNWGGRDGFTRVDYNQQGRMTFRNRHLLGPPPAPPTPFYFDESDVVNMLNLNLGLQWNDNVSLSIFAQNLLDDRGFVSAGQIEENAARSRPRTYGVDFRMTF
jgi:iron complex outermembrane recepter protein